MKRIALALSLSATCLGAIAGDAPSPDRIAAGEEAFLKACAGCHGPAGRGDGPLSALLSVEVPDLTLFAERHDGRFEPALVISRLDGQTAPQAHGGPMPVFGALLDGPSVAIDGPGGTVVATTAPILAITQWLEIQQRRDSQ